MSGYKHVLVALDEQGDTARVARKASALAEATGARLSLLHVVDQRALSAGVEAGVPLFAQTSPADPPALPLATDPQPAPISLDERLLTAARAFLQGIAAEVGGAPAVHVVASASIARQVVTTARVLGADLLVCGAHHRHGLALFLPSPVDGIVHHLPCDVLLVRLPA